MRCEPVSRAHSGILKGTTVPKYAYKEIKFQRPTMEIIDKADEICRTYAGQGLTLTLRQLYYQFVSRNLIANRDSEYKRLGAILNDARLAGLIDWNHVEDRTRFLRSISTWRSPESIIDAAAQGYRRNLWSTQPTHVEVWIEKDALVGVIEGVCIENRVGYFACRGYPSQSEVWGAAMRFLPHLREAKDVHILHLGDHDPSGIDMTRDLEDRLRMFAYQHTREGTITIDRLALNMSQVDEYDPPPNPAKLTDARAQGYIEQYGSDSWELDALEPTVIGALIQAAISERVDSSEWVKAVEREEREREQLEKISRRYDAVVAMLDDYDE